MNEHDATVSIRERVKAPPAKALVDAYFAPSVAAGIRFQFAPEMRIHLAHAVMLERQGIVSRADIARILRVLLDLRATGPESLGIDYRQEDLYSYVETHIVRTLGPEVGGRLHTARSRNDLHTTSWRLALRARLLDLLQALIALRRATLDLALRHAETVMPGYTHTQHAQPVSLGYYLLTAAEVLGRDFTRLLGALDHCDCCPLGAGALTTTGFPIDRQLVADLLGFRQLLEIAYDGVSCRDDAHEAVAAAAVMMTGLSRLATDLKSWNTMEYGMIELADEYSAVSSIMPQKKNPQALEHIKGAAAKVTGALTTALACSKNTALADVNDGVTALNLAEIGFGTATELSDVIVRETGMSFRMAHNIVGKVVRETIEAGRTALDIDAGALEAASQSLFARGLGISDAVVRNALDPMENIRLRTVAGGPAPVRMQEMVSGRITALERDEGSVRTTLQRIARADERLESMVSALLA
jgi:argininosuccinate lyase